MKRITIDYGIDLGTTNSSICRMEKGTPTIIRSDNGMETMPSCISFKKSGAIKVGYSAFADLANSRMRAFKKKSEPDSNSCIEFKRFMGSDMTFANSYADHDWLPEELSAQVLKTLCSFVTDEEVKAAVITVPAKFTVNQKDATLEAAHLAGLEQVELLQEPIAASMAYGLKATDKNGMWMVFDFGGGTLDVALVHVSDGVMQVFDTEGDNYLGGKNLDEAIVAKILLPEILSRYVIDTTDRTQMKLLSEALKTEAEKLKNTLSYKESETICLEAGDWGEDADGEEIELELTISRGRLEEAMRPTLQKAVDTCKDLMMRNKIPYGKLSHLILIGGPTYIPLLRKMLREQISPNIETGIDPMTAVAQGAALYAATIPLKEKLNKTHDGNTIQFEINFESACVERETYVTVHTRNPIKGLTVRLIRTADGWMTEEVAVGTDGALLTAELLAGQPNTFMMLAAMEGWTIPCVPEEFTVIQGTKAGNAILPYNIGIEVYNPKKLRGVFTSMNGLEKNRPLPASGNVYGLKTMSDIFGGNEETKIKIPIYQADMEAEGKTASLYEYVSDVEITGDDVSSYIPKGSHVNVRIDVDRSEMMTVRCEFPLSRQWVEKKLDTSKRQSAKSEEYLHGLISRTDAQLCQLADQLDNDEETRGLKNRLKLVEEELRSGSQIKQVEQHLKEVMRQVEEYESASEWDRSRKALQKALLSLQIEGAKKSDDANVTKMVDSFTAQTEHIIESKDAGKARFLQRQIEAYRYAITRDEIYRDVIRWADQNFFSINWTDREKAQKLVMQAMAILNNNANAPFEEIRDVTEQFYALIKSDDAQNAGQSDTDSGENIKINILSM